ncbi:MAG TPA: M23 family metallopeptidase [Candidatus Udaeobacter sp.]|jgi:murein DD-endopeptidase MepM/ murein hydrolase activator NlpD|nr:M23 family metallopeptidase [Candidatus Udaeobacter sp.]
MNTLEIGRPRKAIAFNRNIVYVILLAALIVGLYFAMPKFEWYKPQIKVSPDTDTLGLAPIEIEINERGTGLKSVSVSLNAGGTEIPLFTEQYDQPVMQKTLTVVSSKLAGVKEGPAVFRISARDRSLWSFFRGNEAVVQKNVTIDITPPTLELIADDPYINFGGAGIIVYKTSADAVSSGVKIGSYFFPGYKGQVKDPNAYMVFFAHPYNVSENEKAVLVATDKAGNIRQMKLSYTLKDVRYKKSTIPISDEFIQSKVAPLVNDVGARQQAPKEVFIKVNHDLRKENDEKIRLIGQKTADKMLWNGPFIQLSNSKVEANFADARTYIYHDQAIDTAYHLGFDLSVTKRYPVEAANSGVVSFAGDLGIYGNAIIIDHGLGLSSLYGHLSSIDVKVGDPIKQQQVIGKTGETGLAVGDHLHFATLLQGVPVLPKEWWDPKWIKDNLTPKLDASATETAEEAKPARTAKANRKRR